MNIDTTGFPQVRFGDFGESKPIDEVLLALDALLGLGLPFVLCGEGDVSDQNERPEDRRTVVLWMKANREKMRELILGHIVVQPDAEKRAEMSRFVAGAGKATGYPTFVFGNQTEADDKVKELLGS